MWQTPAFVPYLNPVLTDDMVHVAEKKLKVKLPRSYIDLLRIQNGGYLNRGTPALGDGSINPLYGIGPNFPSILDRDWKEVKGYMKENGIKVPEKIDGLVPFAGDGHYYFCFDYRRTGRSEEPEISYIDLEVFDSDYVVAKDFATLLATMKVDPEPRIGIRSDLDLSGMVELLSSILEVQFKCSDLHLDPQFHAKYDPSRFGIVPDSDKAFPAIWLTANKVQRGYQPKDDFYDKNYEYLFREYGFREHENHDLSFFLTTVRNQDTAEIAVWLRERGLNIELLD